ncbi:MAG: DUF192 domain-containing protein [Treponema sp.]|nr:DUF192 domain-containing protein [Treponema sp.]
MNFRLKYLVLTIIVLHTGITACSAEKLPSTVLKIVRHSPDSEILKTVEITAEIARTEEERGKGLMFREYLPDGEGMLFIFERDQQLSFWMKNTLIPLSIAFISSDGRISEIKDMQPHNENSVLSSRKVRYALEVPQGWFQRMGIQTGDTVTGIK